jgi:hypothetical protein
MLISVHMPKTAGSSFQATLAGHFKEGLQLDYADRPLHHSGVSRNARAGWQCLRGSFAGLPDQNLRCIHGHFLPLRFRFLRSREPLQFVTWLRDPVQRLVSHYEYWKRSYDAGQSGPLHRQMMEENWSLEDFAARPELRNIYSTFLWGFPLERFDFIGISEDYAEELEQFGRRILHADARPEHINVNPGQGGSDYAISADLRQRIETLHARDMRLYARALELRERRQQ